MVRYSDSEVRVFHPICEEAARRALLRVDASYEVLHHQYTGSLEMDFVVRNRTTGRYLCVIEVKRTPNDVQSARYQFQAQSYVQMNLNNNEKNYFIITNLETLIGFKYDVGRTKIYQQILEPGFVRICDFSGDDDDVITQKLTAAFERIFRSFMNDDTTYLDNEAPFYDYLSSREENGTLRKSNLAILMYEYIRGAFDSTNRRSLYDVRRYNNDVQQICRAGNAIDFNGIFSYNTNEFNSTSNLREIVLAGAYNSGKTNESGDVVADVIFDTETDSKKSKHNGEVPTDPELAFLAATLAKIFGENLGENPIICDPAAGSGNLICAAVTAFPNVAPRNLKANDVNPRFRELLSLRLGLKFPNVICQTNAPEISIENLVNLEPSFFNGVSVILLNPPFVSGVTNKRRKDPFFEKIRALTGARPLTQIGQMNLSAVFLETVCRMACAGTIIVCIYPKAQLGAIGPESVALRTMLLDVFGLCAIFNYPSKGLFKSVSENTCILVGKIGAQSNRVTLFCSNALVSDLDMQQLQNIDVDSICSVNYETLLPAVEAKNFTIQEMRNEIDFGWRRLSKVKNDAVNFINNNISQSNKFQTFAESTNKRKRGNIGNFGLSDLIYFNPGDSLIQSHSQNLLLKEGLRNAKMNDFILKKGDSLVLDVEQNDSEEIEEVINIYLSQPQKKGMQSRKEKNANEIKSIMCNYAQDISPANSIVIPRAIREKGRIHVSTIPLYVSTNFMIFSYENSNDALILASYALTVFFQLESEIESNDRDGLRKQEIANAERMHVPRLNLLSDEQKNRVINSLQNIQFLSLDNPTTRSIDEIWAEILFGPEGNEKLTEATLLLSLLAKERNP